MLTVLGIGAIVSMVRPRRPPSLSMAAPNVTASERVTLLVPEAASAAAPPEATPQRVILTTDPVDAHVFRSGQDLGGSPLTVELAQGESVTLDVKRDGFKPRTVVADGSSAELKVKLAKVSQDRAGKPGAIPSVSKVGGVVVVNPWASK
jgi:serine/threonine-protein kinase